MTTSNHQSLLNSWWENSVFASLIKSSDQKDLSYFSPLSPRFASEKEAEEVMFLKDGLAPLLYFFSCYCQKDLPQMLFIEKDLANFIPEEWLPHCLFYKIYTKNSWDGEKNFLADTIFFDYKNQNVPKALQKINQVLEKTTNKQQTLFLLFEKDLPQELLLKLHQKWPHLQLKLCTASEAEKECKPFLIDGQRLYVELNDKTEVADHHLKHLFLAHGVFEYSMTNNDSSFHEIKTYPLSAFHGVHIYEALRSEKSIKAYEPCHKEKAAILMALKSYETCFQYLQNTPQNYHPFFAKLLEQGLFIKFFDKLLAQARLELGIK